MIASGNWRRTPIRYSVSKTQAIASRAFGASAPKLFLCPPNSVVSRAICFKHIIKQKSCPLKMCFFPPNLKTKLRTGKTTIAETIIAIRCPHAVSPATSSDVGAQSTAPGSSRKSRPLVRAVMLYLWRHRVQSPWYDLLFFEDLFARTFAKLAKIIAAGPNEQLQLVIATTWW